MDHPKVLKDLRPEHDFFIGIDSDGCVFDTMEIKQKEFFIPNAIKQFDLFPVAKVVRETWEFVNLYSIHRGVNRFPALIKVFDLLGKRREIVESGFLLPDLTSLKTWVATESKMSNATLRSYFESNYNPDLEKVVKWSEIVNQDISQWLHDVQPFSHVKVALENISRSADSIVVSQTPLEALEREWEEHGLKKYVKVIAGQEHGTKTEHIAFAAKGKYSDDNILLIGDAKGDLEAATNNGVLFYPIVPGKEEVSWERFNNEAIEKFLNGSFKGRYQESLLSEFMKSLPETPPWEK